MKVVHKPGITMQSCPCSAGHDTTASAISWILYSLAEHPDIQAKCQQEVDDILDGRESDEILW